MLRPRGVLTVPSARAVALAAGADLSRPLLVIDIGAHLTEVVLLSGRRRLRRAPHRRWVRGTSTHAAPAARVAEAVVDMTTSMLRQDDTSLTVDAP
ncbi:hypothetical protein LV779_11085 [Streptomyces thinghirensis]|nr:hypothetical protein [Streptomyces thinghirensis]